MSTTRHKCGCVETSRAWTTLCPEHKAECAALRQAHLDHLRRVRAAVAADMSQGAPEVAAPV